MALTAGLTSGAGAAARATIITDSSGARTLGLADEGNVIRCTHASATAITIPTHASVPIPVGALFTIEQSAAGLVTIDGSGVTFPLPTGIRPARFMGAMAAKASDQTGVNFSGAAAITFPTEDYDTDGFHSTVSNDSRLTIPADKGIKKIILTGTAVLALHATTTRLQISFRKAASEAFEGYVQDSAWIDTSTVANMIVSPPFTVAAAEYYELYLAAETDTSVTVSAPDTHFSIEVVEIDAQGVSAGKDTAMRLQKIATDTWRIGGMFM